MTSELLDSIIVPRPNGSEEFYRVALYIQEKLALWGLPVETHTFTLRPYFSEIAGAVVLLLGLLFFYLAFFRKSWAAAFPALALGLFLFFEFSLGMPVLSGIVARDADNIIVSLHPETAERELIFSAHYDSKTQLFDHNQREMAFTLILPSVGAGALLALMIWMLYRRRRKPGKAAAGTVKGFTVLLLAYWVLLALTFGGGFLARPSPGAIDDGAAVVVLMELADALKEYPLQHTAVTIVFFAGEELNMQGSQAYLRDHPRTDSLPAYHVNLELLCQEGPYIYWPEDGVFTSRFATCIELNDLLGQAVYSITGERLQSLNGDFTTISDSGSFLNAGIPSTTLGNKGSEALGTRFFHSYHDHRGRLVESRIPEAVHILVELIYIFERVRPI